MSQADEITSIDEQITALKFRRAVIARSRAEEVREELKKLEWCRDIVFSHIHVSDDDGDEHLLYFHSSLPIFREADIASRPLAIFPDGESSTWKSVVLKVGDSDFDNCWQVSAENERVLVEFINAANIQVSIDDGLAKLYETLLANRWR